MLPFSFSILMTMGPYSVILLYPELIWPNVLQNKKTSLLLKLVKLCEEVILRLKSLGILRDSILFNPKGFSEILSRIKQVHIPVTFLTLLILEVKLFRMMIIRVLYVCIHLMRLCNDHRDVKNMTF